MVNKMFSLTFFLIVLFSFTFVISGVEAAVVSTFTAELTQESVEAIDEVKASLALIVDSVPMDSTEIQIGSCSVVFMIGVGPTDDSCQPAEGFPAGAQIDINEKTPTEVATEIRSLNILDDNHGALTTGGEGTTVTFTTTGEETSATEINFVDSTEGAIISDSSIAGVVAVPATAQAVTFTPADVSADYTYTIVINGTSYTYTPSGEVVIKDVVEGLQPIVDADEAVECTEDDEKVTCTAAVAGTTFTYSSTVELIPVAEEAPASGIRSSGMRIQSPDNVTLINQIRIQLESLLTQLIQLLNTRLTPAI